MAWERFLHLLKKCVPNYRYRQNEAIDLHKYRTICETNRKKRVSIDVVDGERFRRTPSTLSRGHTTADHYYRSAEFNLLGTLPKKRYDSTKRSAPSLDADARHYRALEKLDDDLVQKMCKHRTECEKAKNRLLANGKGNATNVNGNKANNNNVNNNNNNNNNLNNGHAHHHRHVHHHHSHNHQQIQRRNSCGNKRCVDLKLMKLGNEPQDQGYASERSPEEEHPPTLPGQPLPNVTPGERS